MLTRERNRYCIICIDDFSRFTRVYLFKHKNDDFNAFKIYKTEIENQLSRSIKVLRNDRDGEYFLLNSMHIIKNIVLYMNYILSNHLYLTILQVLNLILLEWLKCSTPPFCTEELCYLRVFGSTVLWERTNGVFYLSNF